MGKASRTKVEPSRREKIAAQQAAARRAEQRRRILIASGSVVVVLVVVLVFVMVKLNSKSPSGSRRRPSNGPHGRGALAPWWTTVTSVPGEYPGHGGRRRDHREDPVDHGDAGGPDGERQARDAVHGRRVLPLLRGRALGDDRGVEPVRHVHGPGTVHSSATGRRPSYPNTPTWSSQVHLHQQVPDLHARRDDDERPGPAPPGLYHASDPQRCSAGADEQVRRRALHRPRTARSRSSTSATST